MPVELTSPRFFASSDACRNVVTPPRRVWLSSWWSLSFKYRWNLDMEVFLPLEFGYVSSWCAIIVLAYSCSWPGHDAYTWSILHHYISNSHPLIPLRPMKLSRCNWTKTFKDMHPRLLVYLLEPQHHWPTPLPNLKGSVASSQMMRSCFLASTISFWPPSPVSIDARCHFCRAAYSA